MEILAAATTSRSSSFSYDQRISWYQHALDVTAQFEGFLVRAWNGFLLRDDCNLDNWNILVDKLVKRSQGNPCLLVDMTLWGGRIGDVDPTATAFPWRNALYSVGIMVMVPIDSKDAQFVYCKLVQKVDKVWKDSSIQSLLQGMFINYPMKSLETDPKAYATAAWGHENLKHLKNIKNKYDPQDHFHSALDIPTSK